MRYMLFTLWFAITVVLLVGVLSSGLFGRAPWKRTLYRALLALFWPLAVLSQAGRSPPFQRPGQGSVMKVVKIVAGAVAVLIALIIVAKSVTTVDTGHRGVKVTFGKPGDISLPEGLYFVNPFTTNMEVLDVRVQRWEDKTQAYTRDVQQATLQFVLNYRLEPTKAHVVYRDVGRNWANTLIGQVIFEEMKREIGQHEAVDLIAQRDQAARTIESNVKKTLADRDILVTGFQLTNIDYTTRVRELGRGEGDRAAEGDRGTEPHRAGEGAGHAAHRDGARLRPKPRCFRPRRKPSPSRSARVR